MLQAQAPCVIGTHVYHGRCEPSSVSRLHLLTVSRLYIRSSFSFLEQPLSVCRSGDLQFSISAWRRLALHRAALIQALPWDRRPPMSVLEAGGSVHRRPQPIPLLPPRCALVWASIPVLVVLSVWRISVRFTWVHCVGARSGHAMVCPFVRFGILVYGIHFFLFLSLLTVSLGCRVAMLTPSLSFLFASAPPCLDANPFSSGGGGNCTRNRAERCRQSRRIVFSLSAFIARHGADTARARRRHSEHGRGGKSCIRVAREWRRGGKG